MKRIITTLLIISLALFTAFASTQLVTLGSSTGWNNSIQGPYMGIHTFYHFGASVNERSTVGIGSSLDVDFALRPLSKGDYDATMALSFGPSFTTDINRNLTFNAMIGPQFDIQKRKIDDLTDLGIGVGGTAALTFIPSAERATRVPMGFTFGLIASLTANVNEGLPCFISTKAFFGFSTLSPYYYPYYGYDIYDDVLVDIFEAY